VYLDHKVHLLHEVCADINTRGVQAEAAAAQVRGLSDTQMRGILTASSYAARGWAGLQARASQPVCAARPPF
jgi:hypothetical protein